MPKDENLNQVIIDRLRQDADVPVYTWLNRQAAVEGALTGRQIEQQAAAQAQRIARHLPRGGVAALALSSGPEFYTALIGCLLSGITVLPLPALAAGPSKQRLETALIALQPDLIIAHGEHCENVRDLARSRGVMSPVMSVELEPHDLQDNSGFVELTYTSPAILQLTSGTTASAKAVKISPANILANARYTESEWGGFTQEDMVVTWLPHYHDMGLFGGLLFPLLCGFGTAQLPTLAFVQRPERWLTALEALKATVTGGPAFALQHCLEMIPEENRAAIDLSAIRIFYCGAEPIPSGLLSEFATGFAASKLNPDAVFGCYGMAEATLFVAGRPNTGTVADCALPASGGTHAVAVLDRQSLSPVAAGIEGEIVVTGPSICKGYINESPEMFLADPQGQIWLRTGDLGYIDGGMLKITGRAKDVLIAGGVNYAAAQVEWLAAAEASELNAFAAAAVNVGEFSAGKIALIIELRRGMKPPADFAQLAPRIQRKCRAEFGLEIDEVLVVPAGTLERTSSGKIRRVAARSRYETGGFEDVKLVPEFRPVLVAETPAPTITRLKSVGRGQS